MVNDNEEFKKIVAKYSKSFVALCVRNTELEDLHWGDPVFSKTGDYSDVKVVTPYGEIPWVTVSRFNNQEMKVLIKDIVNKVYTYMLFQKEKNVQSNLVNYGALFTREWDEPEIDEEFLTCLLTDNAFGEPDSEK